VALKTIIKKIQIPVTCLIVVIYWHIIPEVLSMAVSYLLV